MYRIRILFASCIILTVASCALHHVQRPTHDISLLKQKGDEYFSRGSYLKALALYQRAYRDDSLDATLLLNMSLTYGKIGCYEEANRCLNRTARIDPNNVNIHYCKAELFDRLDNHQLAIDNYTQALLLQPDKAFVYYNDRGNNYHDIDSLELAFRDYQLSSLLKPGLDKPLINMANLIAKRGEYQQALLLYDSIAQICPASFDLYNNRGYTLYQLQRHHDALRDYAKAIKLDRSHNIVYHNRGLCYRALNDHKKALRDFQQSLALDPTDFAAIYDIGYTYFQMGSKEKAIGYIKRAAALGDTSAIRWLATNNH